MIRKKVPTKVICLDLLLPLRLAGKIFDLLDQECCSDEQLLQFVTNVNDYEKFPTKVIRLNLVLPLRLAGKIFALLDHQCDDDEQLLLFVTCVHDTEKEILDYDEYEKSIQPEKT